MKRHLRSLLVVSLLALGLGIFSSTSQAGVFRRGGPFRGYGYGYGYRYHAYGPGWGYGMSRPAGYGYSYGWGGYGMGYRNTTWGYGGMGNPGFSGYGMGYPSMGTGLGYSGYGLGYGGYPAVYGTSISIGTGPYGGFYMSNYPY